MSGEGVDGGRELRGGFGKKGQFGRSDRRVIHVDAERVAHSSGHGLKRRVLTGKVVGALFKTAVLAAERACIHAQSLVH